MELEDKARTITYGEKVVGFGDEDSWKIDQIKRLTSQIINTIHGMPISSEEHKIIIQKAITEAQSAQMWAEKALTWKD